MRPLIGIPLCLDDRGRWKAQREYQYIDTAYARAVEAGGGIPLYLPIQESGEYAVERIDGLLVPGGPDFPPDRGYPEKVRFSPAPPAQLEFDRRVLAAALRRRLPVLGICYGMQLVAVHHGGMLHYDIPTDVPEAGPHQLPEREGEHPLAIEPETRLARALGDARESVNSRHHQAVADPGRGLRISARCDDGLIEAIEREADPFCIGVQWHPETMNGPHRDRLFAAFVSACAAGRAA